MDRPPKSFPYVRKRAGAQVTLYQQTDRKKGYQLVHYEDGKRIVRTRVSWSEALKLADETLIALSQGQTPSHQLTGDDKVAYSQAVSKLGEVGVTLGECVREYVSARTLLGDSTLAEAVQFFIRHRAKLTAMSVSSAFDAFRQQKVTQRSSRYVETIDYHLKKFAEAHQLNVDDVTADLLEEWIDGHFQRGRTFNNAAGSFKTFFLWCKKKGYLPSDVPTEAEKLPESPEKDEAVAIFSPNILKRMLKEIDSRLVPYVALSAFGGFRPSEARRLQWSDFNWNGDNPYIHVTVTVAQKTLRDRFVPILPALSAFLADYRQETGPVITFKTVHLMLTEAHQKLPFIESWPQNGLRHSFGSYRLAATNDINATAVEMGNTPEVIKKNYRRPIDRATAEQWFAIRP
jgi:integrase